mmetsp:Transcript_47504/g.112983  ORF Transcript_47504/g.112983 Transcript_47504/m.112983 type:complete len:213 (-) Transcript_47504:530-1168(-)
MGPFRGGAAPASTSRASELWTHFCGTGTSSQQRRSFASWRTKASIASSAYSAAPRKFCRKGSAVGRPCAMRGTKQSSPGQRRSSAMGALMSSNALRAWPKGSRCKGKRLARRCTLSPQDHPRRSKVGPSLGMLLGGERKPSRKIPSWRARIPVATSFSWRACSARLLGPNSRCSMRGRARPSKGLRKTRRSVTRWRSRPSAVQEQGYDRASP